MGKNLGGAIIDLLASERVELRAAAATVLAAVGKGDRAVEAALADRLDDPDAVVRRIALEALVDIGAGGIAPRLIPLLRSDDETLAERARELLVEAGAGAEAALRKEVGAGPLPARRVMAQLLIQRGTQPALDAVLDQLGDAELGEQALQLVRAELDRTRNEARNEAKNEARDGAKNEARPDAARSDAGKPDGKAKGKAGGKAAKAAAKAAATGAGAKASARAEAAADRFADLVEKAAIERTGEAGKQLARSWSAAQRAGAAPARPTAKRSKARAAEPPPPSPADPLRDPDVVRGVAVLGGLLRLIGYSARPSAQPLLLKYAGADHPRPIRLAAIAGLRRLVASGEVRGTEKVIAAMIELADGDDPAVAQAAIDTLRGARIPEALARPFAALAKSKNAAAQKLAMERMPAGGGASAIKPLVEALGGDDPTARDAAARGLAKAPEAVLPVTRALLATTDEQVARRHAGVLRSLRGHVSGDALDELVERVRELMEREARGKASADQIVFERLLGELIADLAPARHVELLFDRARRLRKAGKSVEAFGSLRPLLRARADIDAAIDDEQRFLLAVLALEAAGDALLRATHIDDPVFEQFSRLAARGFPVARRLAREREVTDESIYALGFRLLESGKHNSRPGHTGADNEELGAELLEGIIEERPRSKLAKAARNKLKLTGHLEE